MPDWTQYIREHLPRDRFRGELEGEILEELAGHLEDAYTEALSRGAVPEEAEAQVVAEIQDWEALARNILRARLGAKESRSNQAMESSEARIRERGGRWIALADLMQEFRLTLRRLRNSPAFTLVALLTLAIGIGATTAIFSVVKGVLLDPLPYEDAHELVWVGNAAPGMGEDLNFQSLAFNAMYEDEGRSFEAVGVWTTATATVEGTEGPQEFSDVLGIPEDNQAILDTAIVDLIPLDLRPGRGAYDQPWWWDLDLSFRWEVGIYKKLSTEVFVDAFNVLNPQMRLTRGDDLQIDYDEAPFGVTADNITDRSIYRFQELRTSQAPRSFQLGVRFAF